MKMTKNILISLISVSVLTAMIMIFAYPYRIWGDCMEPAYQEGKWYFLNKASRFLTKYQIGDVILFNHENNIWIARIVALEKDMIKINKDVLTVNNSILQDSVQRNWSDWQYGTYGINTAFQIPSNHVYVLSDNLSAHHDDSRVFGAIPYSAVLGKLW